MTIYELIILSCQEHIFATINWIHAILLESPLWNRNICFTGYTHQGWEVLRAVLAFKVSLCWGACKSMKKHLKRFVFGWSTTRLLAYMFWWPTHDFFYESILLHYMLQIRVSFTSLHCILQINACNSWSCKWTAHAAATNFIFAPFKHKFFSSWSEHRVIISLSGVKIDQMHGRASWDQSGWWCPIQ